IIVDAGNALFGDTRRREAALREQGLHFVGSGVSGGEEGALNGPSIMPGGTKESYDRLGPMFEKISAHVDGDPCCTHVGADGAGHFVKMVHNGIEYADMQVISEAYDLMTKALGKGASEIGDVFAEWNKGDLESFLIEITAEVLHHTDATSGKPFVDVILDRAAQKGTGAWRARGSCRPRRRPSRSPTRPSSPTTCRRRSTPRRLPPTRRALTRSPPARRCTAGTSTSARWRGSGAAAASSAPASSTASPRPTSATPRCRCCWRTSTSPPRSPSASRPGAASWPSRRPPASRSRCSPRPCPTTTRSVPSASRPPWSRPSATTSAPTPTSASTPRAPSTSSGPRTAARRSRTDLTVHARRPGPRGPGLLGVRRAAV